MHLFTDIGCLYGLREGTKPLGGTDLAQINCIEDAYLLVEGTDISDYGPMSAMPAALQKIPKAQCQSLKGCYMLPAFCDSHTHLVFARSREEEFVQRLAGKTYTEIAQAGGGILHSARHMAEISEEALFLCSWQRLEQAMAMGTGAIEIKTGYGLLPEVEKKMLRVIHRIRKKARIPVRVSYLALHALPKSYADRRAAYIKMVSEEMVPWVAKEKMADYVDVFCERGFFSAEECQQVLQAAAARGLSTKLHAEQLSNSGGVKLGLGMGARSVDHVEQLRQEDIPLLAQSNTLATLLPTSAFFLGEKYAPARALIDGGAKVALASDYNPGSSPSANLHFTWSLACIAMRMLPEEAFQALTFNGAVAMDCQDRVGSIAQGKLANLLITEPISSLSYLPYSVTQPWLAGIMMAGEWHSFLK